MKEATIFTTGFLAQKLVPMQGINSISKKLFSIAAMYVLCQLGGIVFLRKNGTMQQNHVERTNSKVILELMQLPFMLGG